MFVERIFFQYMTVKHINPQSDDNPNQIRNISNDNTIIIPSYYHYNTIILP